MTDQSAFKKALEKFWVVRDEQTARQRQAGRSDQGSRSAVTAGRHLDGFCDAIQEIFVSAGIRAEYVNSGRKLSIPGFFRPTKEWDVVVTNGVELGALIELKSQVGSLGNNFNNRAEEAIGNAKDVRVAFREGLLGSEPPLLGFLMVFEDNAEAIRERLSSSRFFEIDEAFRNSSYANRYQELFRRLVREQLYDTACLLPTSSDNSSHVVVADDVALHQFLSKIVTRAGYLANLRGGWA